MTFEKQTITLPNSLYGDKDVTAYCAGGLGVCRYGKTRWQVAHVASGYTLGAGRGGDRRTRKGALAVMAALSEIAIDWTKPYEEIKNGIAAHKNEVTLALATARNQ